MSIVYLNNGENGGSEMCSYNDLANSLNCQRPDGIASIYARQGEIAWEGNSVTGDVGGQFATHINADGASQALGAHV
jgi:hypothetical protein